LSASNYIAFGASKNFVAASSNIDSQTTTKFIEYDERKITRKHCSTAGQMRDKYGHATGRMHSIAWPVWKHPVES